MNQGPCEHMLALFKASEQMRGDAPTSVAADEKDLAGPKKRPARWEVDNSLEEDQVFE